VTGDNVNDFDFGDVIKPKDKEEDFDFNFKKDE